MSKEIPLFRAVSIGALLALLLKDLRVSGETGHPQTGLLGLPSDTIDNISGILKKYAAELDENHLELLEGIHSSSFAEAG